MASTDCAPTDRIMQTLRVHVPGATDPLLQLELFNVIDEFFRRTSAWRYEEDVDLEVDRYEYALSTPADTSIVRLIAVSHNNVPVPPAAQIGVTESSLGVLLPEMTFPDGDASFKPSLTDLNSGNHIFSYAVYRPGYIQTTGEITPEMTQLPMKAILALTLARSCLECDCGDWTMEDWMYDTFFHDWLNGTLGRLYGMPAKPWSNAQLAAVYEKRFRNKMAYRKQEANRGFTYNIPAWRFPRGGWVG